MSIVEIPREIDRFILYFGTKKHEVNAYALATALIGLADAVREANASVNPGYEVEVVVESFEDGSFQAVIRTIFNKSRNLFSNEAVKQIIYGLITVFIWEKVLKTEAPVTLIVNEEMVVLESGNEKIIVPRNVFEAKKQLEKSEHFNSAVGQIFQGALSDRSIDGVGLKILPGPARPPVYVPREKFTIFDVRRIDEDGIREIVELTNLEISKAILGRGKRKWEFVWRGIPISAPVLDKGFYDRFFAREITIAPGDGLRVALRVVQRKDPDTGIFKNQRYEIIEVFEHLPRMQQSDI